MFILIACAYIDILVVSLWEQSIQHFSAAQTPVFMEVFIFLSRPDTSNSRVGFSTDGSNSRPDRIVTISQDIAASLSSSTSSSKIYFLFTLHDPTSGQCRVVNSIIDDPTQFMYIGHVWNCLGLKSLQLKKYGSLDQ